MAKRKETTVRPYGEKVSYIDVTRAGANPTSADPNKYRQYNAPMHAPKSRASYPKKARTSGSRTAKPISGGAVGIRKANSGANNTRKRK